MSDVRAIEAVTQTLRGVLDAAVRTAVPGATAVARPPDQVTVTGTDPVLNLFLYQTDVDPALRNLDPPGIAAGEPGYPALPLILTYLLTPFSPDSNDMRAHRLLGAALGALHAHAVLTADDLAAAAPFSDISRQLERVRINWQPFEEKDIYSMWSVFQSPYRLSVAFEVQVVQIDSRRHAPAPLPVLTREADGRGPVAAATATSVPAITSVRYPPGRPAALVGDRVELHGGRLGGATAVRIRHPALAAPLDLPVVSATPEKVTFAVPATVPAGLSSASVVLGATPDAPVVGDVYVAVAPTLPGLPQSVASGPGGLAVIDITCVPDLWPGQQVELLLGSRRVRAVAGPATPTPTARFRIAAATLGGHRARVRVDGVESLLVADRAATPPIFDPTQTVTVT